MELYADKEAAKFFFSSLSVFFKLIACLCPTVTNTVWKIFSFYPFLLYVPAADIRGLRTVIRQRQKLVQNRTTIVNRVHSMLDKYDIAKVSASAMYSKKALEQLQSALAARFSPVCGG